MLPVALHFNGMLSPLAPQWPYLIQNVRGSLCLFHLQGPEGHPATALHPAVVVRFVLHLQERGAMFSFIVIVIPATGILLRVLKMSGQACCSTHERIFGDSLERLEYCFLMVMSSTSPLR